MRSLFFNFLSILIFSICTFSAAAQPSEDGPITDLGTITNEGDGIYIPFEFCLNPDNELIVKTNIILGNLTIVGIAPNEYGVLPANVPAMFIEYTVNGQVLPAVQVGNFDLVTLSGGYQAFSYIAQSPAVDFSSECASALDGYVYGNVKFRLVTPNGNGWSTYPACDYSQSWDMFSCNIYSYAPWCDAVPINGFADVPTDPTASCYNEWFAGGYSAKMYCDCSVDELPQEEEPREDDGGDQIDGGGDNGNSSIKKRRIDNVTINAYPNPMNHNLIIESNDDFIRTIDIYNSRGELVLKNTYELNKILNTNIITSEFLKGLYLIRVTTNSNIKVIKVLK